MVLMLEAVSCHFWHKRCRQHPAVLISFVLPRVIFCNISVSSQCSNSLESTDNPGTVVSCQNGSGIYKAEKIEVEKDLLGDH